MKIAVINGPNINMLGIRERDIYGHKSYSDLIQLINDYCAVNDIEVVFYQSNHEGELVDYIQKCYTNNINGIVINPAAYTHTSVAILDALKAVNIPAVEVHISDVSNRERFRQISYIRDYCVASIIGRGFDGYIDAVNILKKNYETENQ